MIKDFKIFESIDIENYELLASNDCHWSYEYDARHSIAKILLDKNDKSLYLKLIIIANSVINGF